MKAPQIRPEEAERLLQNETFNRCMGALEYSIVQQMKSTGPGDIDRHHDLVLSLQARESIFQILNSIAQSQDISDHNKKMAEKIK